MFRFFPPRLKWRSWRSLGFTQLEIMVILGIIAIMAAIAFPSLSGMLEAAKVKQASAEIRVAFQETQRTAIRNGKSCLTNVIIPAQINQATAIRGDCLMTGDRNLPEGIGLATNVRPSAIPLATSNSLNPTANHPSNTDNSSLSFQPNSTEIKQASVLAQIFCYFFPKLCQASNSSGIEHEKLEVDVAFDQLGGAHFDITQPSNNPFAEYSAKFISFRPQQLQAKKSCVVLSGSLGLTRIGTYTGDLDPEKISTEGKCQVANWVKQ